MFAITIEYRIAPTMNVATREVLDKSPMRSPTMKIMKKRMKIEALVDRKMKELKMWVFRRGR